MSKSRKPSMTLIVTLVGAVAVGAIVMAQTNGKIAAKLTKAALVKTGPSDTPIQLVMADRHPLDYYTGGVRSDLFNGPIPEAPKSKIDPKAVKRGAILPDISMPVEVNPFSDYTYSGTMTMNGETIGLVENNKTKEGQFLHMGDSFLGGKVSTISDLTLNVTLAGKEEMLAKSDTYKLVPLDKSAPYLTQQAQPQGVPQGQGMPLGMPGAPSAAGAPAWMQNLPADAQARIKARMESMTPEQRDAMTTRMQNGQFNGGGGRGNRGGGGGGGRGRNLGGGGFGGGFGG